MEKETQDNGRGGITNHKEGCRCFACLRKHRGKRDAKGFTMRMSNDLKAELDQHCADYGRERTAVIESALIQYMAGGYSDDVRMYDALPEDCMRRSMLKKFLSVQGESVVDTVHDGCSISDTFFIPCEDGRQVKCEMKWSRVKENEAQNN